MDILPSDDLMQGKIAEILISADYQSEKANMPKEHILNSAFFSCKYYTVCLIITDNSDTDFYISKAVTRFTATKGIKFLKTQKNAAALYIFAGNDKSLSDTLSGSFENELPPAYIGNSQICIGNTVSKVQDISASYINAYILTEYSFYTKKGVHIYNQKMNYGASEKPYDAAIFNIDSLPCYEEGFNAFLKKIYLSLKETASVPKKSVHILFLNIINHMFIQAKNKGAGCDVIMDDIFYRNFLTIDDLYLFAHNFVAEHSLYTPINKTAFNIRNYIKQNYNNKNLSIDMIAFEFNMSPQYIPKIFKKAFGIPIIQYVTDTRIAAAKTLIQTQDIGIKNIAEAVGYDDANYFSRLFKKKTGMTFSEYKRQLNL